MKNTSEDKEETMTKKRELILSPQKLFSKFVGRYSDVKLMPQKTEGGRTSYIITREGKTFLMCCRKLLPSGRKRRNYPYKTTETNMRVMAQMHPEVLSNDMHDQFARVVLLGADGRPIPDLVCPELIAPGRSSSRRKAWKGA